MWKQLKNALPQASGKRLGHNLTRKAHRNRHRCVNCGPSEENRRNNDPWIFDTRNALKKHSLTAHKDLYDDKVNYILCNICGNIIGKEVTDCGFLKPRKPSCGRISNMSSKEVDSILIQQLRDKKKRFGKSESEEEEEEEEEVEEEVVVVVEDEEEEEKEVAVTVAVAEEAAAEVVVEEEEEEEDDDEEVK